MTTIPRTQHASRRWMKCRNVGTKRIPPFAIMRLVGAPRTSSSSEDNNFINQEYRDQEVVWRVAQIHKGTEQLQLPAMCVVNGPGSILPGKYGECSQDWPLQVRHDGSADSLPNGKPCGPKEGEWEVYSTGWAFTCLSHDVSAQIGTGDIHTVWIAPSFATNPVYYCVTPDNQTVLSGKNVSFPSALKVASKVKRNDDADGAQVLFDGVYQFHWSCTMKGDSGVDRGSALQLTAHKNDDSAGFIGQREHDIEEDQYGTDIHTANENVHFHGILEMEKDDVLKIKNTSAYDIVLSRCIFSINRIDHRDDAFDSTGGLVFP